MDSSPPVAAAVVPAYNEAGTIRDVVAGVLAHIEMVIVVDDGSTDGTAEALVGLSVTVLRNERNLGKAASLRRGLADALDRGAAAVVTLDGDGQHDPADIPRLLAAHRQNAGQIVIGARLHDRTRIPTARYLANRFANFWVTLATGYGCADSQSGFRVYPAGVLRAVLDDNRSTRFVFETEILIDAARAGIRSVPVRIAALYERDSRPSHFRPVSDVLLISRMIAWKILSRAACMGGVLRDLRHGGRGQESA